MYQIWEGDVPSTAMHSGQRNFGSVQCLKGLKIGVPKSLIGTSYSPSRGCLAQGIYSQNVYFLSWQQLPIMSTAYPPIISKQPCDLVPAHVCSCGTLMQLIDQNSLQSGKLHCRRNFSFTTCNKKNVYLMCKKDDVQISLQANVCGTLLTYLTTVEICSARSSNGS